MKKSRQKRAAKRSLNEHFRVRLEKYSELLEKIIGDYGYGHILAVESMPVLNGDDENFLYNWARKEFREKYAKELYRRKKCLEELRGEIAYILETSCSESLLKNPDDISFLDLHLAL